MKKEQLKKRISELLREKLEIAKNDTERYQLQAELEDLEDGHWVGKRTDASPDRLSEIEAEIRVERVRELGEEETARREGVEKAEIDDDEYRNPEKYV